MVRPLSPRLLALLTVSALTVGCHRSEGTNREAPGATAPAATDPASPPAVKVPAKLLVPEKVDYEPRVAVTGNLKPLQSAALAFPVAGVLERVRVKRGQQVLEGTVLAALDGAAARAALAQAEAGVEAARAQLRLSEDALARTTVIRKEEGVSAAQHFQAESQRDLAAAQVQAAVAQRDQAQVFLRNHTLKAPFTGVVIRVPDGVGFSVGPAVPLFVVESTRSLLLETSVTQEEAADLRVGMAVEVTVPATGEVTPSLESSGAEEEQAKARIRVIVPSVDTATNRVPIEIEVPNPTGRFHPHAFARAEIRGKPRSAWLVLPSTLTQRDGSFAAWIVGDGARARAVRVRVLGERNGSPVVIPTGAGWENGTRLVATPPLGIREGAELTVVTAP